MCIFSLDQTKLWVIIFIIIKQSPMCISRICMDSQNRILVGNGILLGNPFVSFSVSYAIKIKYFYQLTDTCSSICFHIFHYFFNAFSSNHGNTRLATC